MRFSRKRPILPKLVSWFVKLVFERETNRTSDLFLQGCAPPELFFPHSGNKRDGNYFFLTTEEKSAQGST
jgi:hypothetical protein